MEDKLLLVEYCTAFSFCYVFDDKSKERKCRCGASVAMYLGPHLVVLVQHDIRFIEDHTLDHINLCK